MADIDTLTTYLNKVAGNKIQETIVSLDELTIEVKPELLSEVSHLLRNDTQLSFDMLIDICGVDYLNYGISEWLTEQATGSGFERGVETDRKFKIAAWPKPRFAVVYHFLSIQHNHRIRLRCFPEGEPPVINSVIDIWPAANWFERETFDLFGIVFDGHPDLRRILTDYGFVGHPFRKDFPLIGNVEVRYDATQKRVVYEPVGIASRTLVPKVIRRDNRHEVQPSPPASSGSS